MINMNYTFTNYYISFQSRTNVDEAARREAFTYL